MIQIQKKFNWVWYSFGYIHSTLTLIDRLYTTCDEEPTKPEARASWLHERYIILVVFFDIRHSLELTIKSAQRLNDEKVTTSHDIEVLYVELQNVYGSTDIRVIKLRGLIDKYYKARYYRDNYNVAIEEIDEINTFFRYPEAKKDNVKSFDPRPLTKFTRTQLDELKADVQELKQVFIQLSQR